MNRRRWEMTVGDEGEAVIGVWTALSIWLRACMLILTKPWSVPHLDVYANSSSSFKPCLISWCGNSSTWHPPTLNINLPNQALVHIADTSICRGWPKRNQGTDCRILQVERGLTVLLASLCMSAILILLNSSIDITCIHQQLPCSTPLEFSKMNLSVKHY